MATRAPIIISNGGVASALTKGLIPATRGKNPTKKQEQAAVKVIMKNLKALNAPSNTQNPPEARSLKGSKKNNDPKIYWRLEKEKAHRREIGLDAR